jgi:L-ascorbate metabolism protein UlaG (beta-lactamase superfamily)
MTEVNRAEGEMKKVLVTIALMALLSIPGIALGERDVEPVFTPIQHATFVIQSANGTILVDPVGKAEAFAPYGTPDIILVTDIHGDHLAPDVIQALAKDKPTIIGPKAVIDKLKVGTALKNGETTSVGKTKIEAIPMYNLTEERLKFHEKGRGNGYLVTLGGKRIYISGDTEDIPEMRALMDIDYAFVCMNLPYTMTVKQAADAVLAFQPRVVFPYHYRGQGGFSDVEEFKKLVSKDGSIEVRLLEWYE